MIASSRAVAALLALTTLGAIGCQGVAGQDEPGSAQLDETGIELYQIGDRWDRQLVHISVELAADAERVQRRVLSATARYDGPRLGTALYLGEHAGHHLMMTNAHVWKAGACYLAALDQSYGCGRSFGVWQDVDLALFELEVPEASRAGMPQPVTLATTGPRRGQALLTAGFGGARNDDEYLTYERGSDCRVLSADDDVRPISDPDQLHPGESRVWSFATGCDVSHGDSGSAVFDRETGEIVGLNWTTATPKPEAVKSSDHLRRMSDDDAPELWTQLEYAVPATKIRLRLQDALDGELDDDTRAVITSLVGAP